MRHPLVGIKAGLELIARRLGTQVTDLDDWQMVATQVVRLEELFRSYQQLFAPEPAAASKFAVESVVQRAVDLVAWRVRRLGPRFEWLREASHHALGSTTALLHALINVLVNAVDAVHDGGGGRRPAGVPGDFVSAFWRRGPGACGGGSEGRRGHRGRGGRRRRSLVAPRRHFGPRRRPAPACGRFGPHWTRWPDGPATRRPQPPHHRRGNAADGP